MSASIEKKVRSGSEKDRFNSSYAAIPWSGCWIWTRSIDEDGYGVHYFQGKKQFAHRRSFELFNGAIPEGMLICHRCDIPACVNPSHLFVGTCKDNIHDAMKKNRFGYGEKNSHSKLTAKQVEYIRNGSVETRILVKELGVTKSMINGIKRGAYWRHTL